MSTAQVIAVLAGGLLLSRWAMELWLAWLNRRHVAAHAGEVPAPFREFIAPPVYARSVQYTLARLRLGRWEQSFDLAVAGVLLFSGVLPWALDRFVAWQGDSAWAMAAFLVGLSLLLSTLGWPLAWYEQFRLEEKFGFNTTRPATWWLDRLKGMALTVALGYPLLVLVLKIVRWTGPQWWLWAWAAVAAFQLLLMVLAPVLILPLFNKFSPLADGSLKERLLGLARRTGFRVGALQVMDGSKRSRHSNAFFTGFGRFRKIVLFDTLLAQLTESEVEAVLAHEIGHYRLRHIAKLLLGSMAGLLAGFYVLSRLAESKAFYEAFGFLPGDIEPAFLLFALLSGSVVFWFSPLLHFWSRRFERQADAFACRAVGGPQALVSALRKLNEKNLSNLTPHPLYSGFYYSHPSLLEREAALAKAGSALPGPA